MKSISDKLKEIGNILFLIAIFRKSCLLRENVEE
jgi:hypothetical protein